MALVQWECVPDDVIEVIVIELVKPLKNNDRQEKMCSDKHTTIPTPFEKTVYAYFSLFFTSKQFYRVARGIDFDWLTIVGNPYGNHRFRYQMEIHQKEQEALLDPKEREVLALRGLPYLADEPKKMLRTFTMCINSLPVIRNEIDTFMARNNLVYRTKGSNRVYKGYVGIRKLKTMKIQPKSLDDQFKSMLKRHESLNKKRIALDKALGAYAEKLKLEWFVKLKPFRFVCGSC